MSRIWTFATGLAWVALAIGLCNSMVRQYAVVLANPMIEESRIAAQSGQKNNAD